MRYASLLLAAALVPLEAQVILNRPRNPSVITVDVDLVNVLCTVRDGRGAFASGLRKEDFEVRENGRRVEIAHFAPDIDTPLSVALLLDVSGSVRSILEIERQAGRRFFQEVLRPQDKALLVGFAQMIAVWQDLTPEVPLLGAALEKASPFPMTTVNAEHQPRGGTLLYDAIYQTAVRKLRRLSGRKVMVVISDGLDNGSARQPADAAQAAQEGDVAVYGIHYQDSGVSGDGAGALKRLSEPTGGRSFHISGKVPLEAAFDAIRDEMRHQYGIAFKPLDPEMNGEWRKLEVKTRSGLKVQARTGYYAVRK